MNLTHVRVHSDLFVIADQPLDKLLPVMELEIVLPQEGTFSVQIFLEIGIVVLIGFVEGVGNFRIPGFHVPAEAVIVLIGCHIGFKALVTVVFAAKRFLRRKQTVISVSYTHLTLPTKA